MKHFRTKDLKNNDNVALYETETASPRVVSNKTKSTEVAINQEAHQAMASNHESTTKLLSALTGAREDKRYSKWDNYNRSMNFSELDFDALGYKEKLKQHSSSGSLAPFLLVVLSIFIPPLAVYLYEDAITNNFWIDLLLTLFFWIPGIIYALLVVLGTI